MRNSAGLWLLVGAGLLVGWATANAVDKTPAVRLLDVTIHGPLLIWVALGAPPLHRYKRLALAFAGGATIGYNLKNYLGNLRERGTV